MSQQPIRRPQDLEDAFNAFNDMSERLAASYRTLEARVATLNEELAAARCERLKQLAEKERLADRLANLLEALPGGVVVLDERGLVQQCNPAAVELLGDPLLGMAWREIAARAFSAYQVGDQDVSLRDGRRVSVSTRALNTPGQILLLKDVSEIRALQEMLSRHKRLSAMGEMVARLAHQIRTPLASALLYASQINRPQLGGDDRARCAERVLARLRQLERMVNDMLVFARGGEAGAQSVVIGELLDELAQLIEPQLRANNGALHIEINAPVATLSGCREALLGALSNLATNAMQAAGEGAQLYVSVGLGADGVTEIEFSDNGPGIPEEVAERIFEPFFTTRSNGTGLGLAVVRAVVEAHQGKIAIRPSVHGGAAFHMRLPGMVKEACLPSGAFARPPASFAGEAARFVD